MLTRLPRGLATAGTVALLVSCVAACGDDQEKDASPKHSVSPSASSSATETPTPTAAPSPTLPAEAKFTDDKAGRKAFAEFVVQRWAYALRTNDATAVTDLATENESCLGCKELRKELSQRKQEGWFVELPEVTIDKVSVKTAGEEGIYDATAVVDIPASRSSYDDGTFRNDNEGHENATFVVRMGAARKSFDLLGFKVS